MADEPGAIEMYVPQNITFDYTDATWVVVHKTAGFTRAQDCAAYFQAGSNGNNVSSHYIVGQDGTIVQCVPESRGAGANCCPIGSHAPYLPTDVNLNLKTISIEHIDPSIDNSTPVTDAQKAASFRLIQHICERHNIPKRSGDASGGVIGHVDIDPINRARCPGNYPWNELWAYLQQGANMNTTPPQGWPNGWSDDGHTLTAPNGHKVIGGFRNFIYSNFWDDDDYPLEEEHPVSPLELGNSSLGNGTQQIFRKTILEIPQGKGIIKMWTGQEVQASRKALADQQAKLVAVQNAYNAVVTEKNGLIGQITDLKSQLAADNNVNVTLLQQQNTALANKLTQIKSILG